MIGAWLANLWRLWEKFWFQPSDLLPAGIFRFFFGLDLLIMYSLRHLDLESHFTDRGVVSSLDPLQILPAFYRSPVPFYKLITANPFAWHWLYLLTLIFLTLGLFGRMAAAAALILHLAFMQRNVSVVYGADIVACFWLFFLVFIDNSRAFSVSRLWRNRRSVVEKRGSQAEEGWFSATLSTVGIRLLQIQLCIIYGYTGLEKLKGASWWEGTAVWAVLGNNQLMLFDLGFLREFPVLIGLMTHSAVLFEIYFPLLVLFRPLRKWTLIYGWLLHGMIAAGMGLFFFSGAMMSAYFVFMSADGLRTRLSFLPESLLGSRR